MTPLTITEEEFGQYMEFCIDMCDRNRVSWRIERQDGTAVMCVPITKVAPIAPEIQEQVEQFRQQFLDNPPTDTI
jgi:hypothetical protein